MSKAPVETITDAQVEEIKAAREKLMATAQALFTKVYENSAAAAGAAGAGAGSEQAHSTGSDTASDDVVDGEFKEV